MLCFFLSGNSTSKYFITSPLVHVKTCSHQPDNCTPNLLLLIQIISNRRCAILLLNLHNNRPVCLCFFRKNFIIHFLSVKLFLVLLTSSSTSFATYACPTSSLSMKCNVCVIHAAFTLFIFYLPSVTSTGYSFILSQKKLLVRKK